MQLYCQNTIRPKRDTKLCLRVEKWSRSIPVKHSMFTRAIFVRPDSELIRESVCTCANLFVDEENVHMAQIELWKNKRIDGFTKLCLRVEKWSRSM
jgi:hypothetical protein